MLYLIKNFIRRHEGLRNRSIPNKFFTTENFILIHNKLFVSCRCNCKNKKMSQQKFKKTVRKFFIYKSELTDKLTHFLNKRVKCKI